MNALMQTLRELAGLFVDDGALALALIAVIAAAITTAAMLPGTLAPGIVLVGGSIGVLLINVTMTARRWDVDP